MATLTRTSVRWVNDRFIATCLAGYISYSTDQVNWTNINIGTVSNLRSVAYGLGYYIIVGDGGRIARSTNGTTWTITNSLANDYTHIEFAASKFVAVGSAGRIIVSTTGTTFTAYTSGTTAKLNRVRYVNSLWVAIGDEGALTTSTTGTAWTAQTVDTRPLYGIAYLSTATTYKYNAGKKASADGVTWTSFYNNNSTPDTFTKSVYVGGTPSYEYYTLTASNTDRFAGYIAAHPTQNRFYRAGKGARGFGGAWTGDPNNKYTLTGFTNTAWESSQSLGTSTTNSWSQHQQTSQNFALKNDAPTTHLEELNGNLFLGSYICLARDGYFDTPQYSRSFTYILSTAAAGTGFTQQAVQVSFGERDIACPLAAYGNGYYVMLGGNAGLVTSFVQWKGQHHVLRGTTLTGVTRLVTYASGHVKFPIDLGDFGTYSEVVTPTNSPPTAYPFLEAGMTFGAGRFVAVGPRPINNANTNFTTINPASKQFVVVYSTDNGASWNDVTFPQSNGYDISGRVAGSANEIVATCRWYNNGTPGWVMRSTDAVNWSYYYTGFASKVNEIKYLNGYFYTVHDNGGVARSANGITWTTLTSNPADAIMGQTISDIAYIAGRYVLTSNNGYYQTTTNLSSFVTYQNGGPSGFILNDGSKLVSSAFDVNANSWKIRTSTDGITWTEQSVEEASDIAYSGSKYIAIKSGAGTELRESSALGAWSTIQLSNITGVGIIVRDSSNNIRLQSYDANAPTYLCARIIQEDYVAGVNSTIYVNGADGYQIFVVVTPDGASAGGQRIPYVELHRGAAPAYQPYYTVTYPAYGGSGSTVNPANVYCTVFTTGEVEKITY